MFFGVFLVLLEFGLLIGAFGFDEIEQSPDLLFLGLASRANAEILLDPAIEFTVQFHRIGVIGLAQKGQQISELASIELDQDLISL